MTIITDEKERSKILSKLVYGGTDPDYIEAHNWGKDEIVLEYDEGKYAILDCPQEYISRDLWFRDDNEIPEKSEELFINYNLGDYSMEHKKYIMRTGYLIYISDINYISCIKNGIDEVIRPLRDDEKEVIEAALNERKAKFIKRLKTYWKKYNNKVYVCSYWADR